MSNILYLECNSGISGDMTVAALLDLGGNREKLMKTLDSLELSGYEIAITRVKKAGIDCCDFNVILDHDHENHDHDMEYLYGHEHQKEHPIEHHHHHHHGGHDEEGHQHVEEEHTHHHHHTHRGIAEIRGILERGEMTEGARALALRIFSILAEAEAKAHDLPVEEVHFHEVGAVDSIVDIVAAAVLFDDLNIDEVIVPYAAEGTGTVRCQHGVLPVPVPAVLNIAERHGLNLKLLPDRQGELITPTGAAFLAAVKTRDTLPEQFRIRKTGMGAGKRAYKVPSILRAMLLDDPQEEDETEIVKLEANVDDCTGEQLGFVMDLLFQKGARDVSFIPCYMKKNRPGYLIQVICLKQKATVLEEVLFLHTTTIGIRRLPLQRSVLSRTMKKVVTKYGEVRVKEVSVGNRKKHYPEYEDVAKIARERELPYDTVLHLVTEQFHFL